MAWHTAARTIIRRVEECSSAAIGRTISALSRLDEFGPLGELVALGREATSIPSRPGRSRRLLGTLPQPCYDTTADLDVLSGGIEDGMSQVLKLCV